MFFIINLFNGFNYLYVKDERFWNILYLSVMKKIFCFLFCDILSDIMLNLVLGFLIYFYFVFGGYVLKYVFCLWNIWFNV